MLFVVNSTLEEFEDGSYTLKTHQMFSIRATAQEEFLKTQQSPVIFNL